MDVSDLGKQSTTICGIRAMGRRHKKAGTDVRVTAEKVLEVIHAHLCGHMQTIGLSGKQYFITFLDETSGRVSLSLLRTKDAAL